MQKLDVRKSLDMCCFNNPLVTLPSFMTTRRNWFKAVRAAMVRSQTTKHIFSYVTPLLCTKCSHLKVWTSTFLAFLVVSMRLLPHKGKFISVRVPLVRLPQKHQRKQKSLWLQGGRCFRCQISCECRNVYSRQRQQPALQLDMQASLQ